MSATDRLRASDGALLLASTLAIAIACGSACGASGGDDGSEPGGTPSPSTSSAPTPAPTFAPTASPGATPAPSETPSGTATPETTLALRLALVADGLDQPDFLTSVPGDPSRLAVLEQTGRVRIIENGRLLAAPLLDLSKLVSCCGERGLLGLAFHPGYASNGRLFVDYTDLAGDTVIAEYRRSGSAGAAPAEHRVLLRIDQPFPNHNGGMLAFSPEGLLLVGMGDGGGANDPQGNGQRLETKLGKILRLAVDRHPEPPAGNFPGADPDVWAIGLRNPWRFSFDRSTGDLWIGDVGQNRLEEIDVARSGASGLDFGWNVLEGSQCLPPATVCRREGKTLPVTEYGRDLGCSVIGGYVYRGPIPGLGGRYFFGDYCTGRVWSLDAARSAPLPAGAVDRREHTAELDPGGGVGLITSFGEDADGNLYVVTGQGRVWRIEGAAD